MIFYPETNRRIVGNGSVRPKYWNMSYTDVYRMRRNQTSPAKEDNEKQGSSETRAVPWWQGLTGSFLVLKEFDIVLGIVQNAIW